MASNNIKIVNFEDNEIVTYPYIIVRGTIIENSLPTCCLADKHMKIIIRNMLKEKSITMYLLTNTFKCLMELPLGENNIILRKCCQEKMITIHHNVRNTIFTVVPLYIICADDKYNGHFQAPEIEDNSPESACNRIDTISKLIQCVIADKLYDLGFGKKTYQLEDCIIYNSQLKAERARKMAQQELWMYLAREIMNSSIGNNTKKYMAFMSTTRYRGRNYKGNVIYSHEYMLQLTDGYVALGGGGLALFGTACLYTWPDSYDNVVRRFQDDSVVNRKLFMDDSCYRSTLGACFATTMGSILHELCHTFDLGHTSTGIMGRGFDNVQKVFLSEYKNGKLKSHELKLNQIQRCQMGESENLPPILSNPNAFEENHDLPSNITIKLDHEMEHNCDTSSGSNNLYSAGNSFAKPGDNFSSRADIPSTSNDTSNFYPAGNSSKDDETYFTKSNAAMLAYHRWFNDYVPCTRNFSIKFDSVALVVRGTAGLRVIELRHRTNELVLYDWFFTGRVLKYSFQIPEETKKALKNKMVILVVEDNAGNILKEKIFVS